MSGCNVSRRTVLLGGLAGAVTLGMGVPRATAASDSRPNILLITTDDQNLESMRVMGNVHRQLVDRGTTFTNSLVSWPVCGPSRATMLTGQYAHRHGMIGNFPPLGGIQRLDETNTLPVWLQRAGYHTAQVGKYVNGYGLDAPANVPPGWSDWNADVDDPGNENYYNTTLNENGTLVSY